ncbi:hypothetical protein [Gorillibacterium sp. CAU 1737]|uniref:GAP1-N2 domain-containing protein n=1 Tax=Gorillibacterium sp. CAU 1737 TaxID=3140362 RepID=UPI0032608B75
MTEASIQQHYYTRGREGLFQGGEGFDTVAKSTGLEASFIRKTLHPYCLYIAPQELIRRGETDPSKYPEALTVFPAETGELVIGRAVFSGSDFTGQREAVFIHQYIVPRSLRDDFLQQPSSFLHITSFRDRYDENEGKELPELEKLPHRDAPTPDERDALLARLGVGEPIFKALLAAIFTALSSKKKVYIALDAEIGESARLAADLLDVLYVGLPLEIRRQFGFTTYNNEPQAKKGIDLMFVEKTSLRPGDRVMGKDLVFDFPNGRFPAPEPGSHSSFLDLAWAWRNEPDKLEDFYDFAREALAGMGKADSVSLSAYQELATAYRTSFGDLEPYRRDKGELVASLVRYLKAGGPESKPRVNEILLALLRQEQGEATPAPLPQGALSAFMAYYDLAPDDHREEVAAAIVDFLERAASAPSSRDLKGKDEPSAMAEAGEALRKHADLQRLVYERTGRDVRYSALQEVLLADRMNRVKSVKELQEEIVFWATHSFDSLGLPYFIEQFRDKLRRTLQKSGDQAVAGESLFHFCSQLYKAHSSRRGFGSFCDALEIETARVVLDAITLQTATYAELMQGNYLWAEERLLTGVGLTEEQLDKLRLLSGVYEAMVNLGPSAALRPDKPQNADSRDSYSGKLLPPVGTNREGMESPAASSPQPTDGTPRFPWERYGNKELAQIQELVRRFLKARVHPAQYGPLLFAFTDYKVSTGGEDKPISFFDLLTFVGRETEGTDGLDDFLLWSSTEPAFRDAGGRMLRPAYRNALRKYFTEVDRRGLKDRKRYRELTDESLPKEFRKVIASIREESGNPALRFLKRHSRSLTLCVLVLALGTAAYLLIGQSGKGEKPASSPSPVLSPSPTSTDSSSPSPDASGSPSGSPGATATPASPSPSGSTSPQTESASPSPSPASP